MHAGKVIGGTLVLLTAIGWACYLTGTGWPALAVVVLSAAWAAWDSDRLRMHLYRGGTDGPVPVFLVVCLVWVVGFPVYLLRRSRRLAGELPLKNPGRPVGAPEADAAAEPGS